MPRQSSRGAAAALTRKKTGPLGVEPSEPEFGSLTVTGDAGLIGVAARSAIAAVVEIRLRIHAGAIAGGQPAGTAAVLAFAGLAGLIAAANGAARAAMQRIRALVDADAVAAQAAAWTSAFAGRARLTARALHAAAAAVVVAGLQIHAHAAAERAALTQARIARACVVRADAAR